MIKDGGDKGTLASDGVLDNKLSRRVAVRMPVRISTIDPETDPWTGKPYFRTSTETSANVSRGGAFVLTSEPIAPGRRVLLELHLPDGETIQTIGRVAWSRSSFWPAGKTGTAGVGVEFLGGTPEEFAALERFLERSWRRQLREDGSKAPQPNAPPRGA
jgi:Tfp pilus assembly protein PilZ